MPLVDNPAAHASLLSREDMLRHLTAKPWCDVLVVGGGIHGATFAHLAALHGMRTVLLERGDYAQGTSSRSSKLAHGGIRYLEHGDFRQVFEGIRERERLLRIAPHLVKSAEFYAATLRSERVLRAKMQVGLALYSLMAFGRAGFPRRASVPGVLSPEFGEGFLYRDAILSDTRLVIDRILAARQEGAHCLNYAETTLFLHQESGVDVRYTDRVSGTKGSIRAGIVVNTAGPWVPEAGGIVTRDLGEELRLSRGSHVLFAMPWRSPALVLPIRENGRRLPGRYYFVTPHPGGTLVGTTEREVQVPEPDPSPAVDEIDEILGRVERDLPESGLTRERAFYCFAGYRALPAGSAHVDALSRRHRWRFRKGVLSLIGGKYTSAAWTCEEGFRLLLRVTGTSLKRAYLKDRMLPGAANLAQRSAAFLNACRDMQISPQIQEHTLARLGGRVERVLEYADGLEVIGGQVLKGEIRLTVEVEQALTLEDVLRRRVELESMPGSGLALAHSVAELMSTVPPAQSFGGSIAQQCDAYGDRITRITTLLKKPSS